MKGAVDRDWAHVTPNQDFDGEGGGFGDLRRGVQTIDVEAVLSSVLAVFRAGRGALLCRTRQQKGLEEEQRHLRQGSR